MQKVFISKDGVVASEHPLASLSGAKILMRGGNAFDAAITVALSLAVLQPHLGGLGSDFFALLYDSKKDKVLCLNSSGWSPKKLTLDLIRSKGLMEFPTRGPLTPVVPGFIKGIFEIYKKFSTKEIKELFEDSIRYSKEGFPVYWQLSNAISSNLQLLYNEEGFRENFLLNDEPPKVGQILKQAKLAKALEEIEEFGPDVFYSGEIAEKIVEYVNSKGGYFCIEDFKEFEPTWEKPLSINYGKTKVYEIPPNSMGITTLSILKLLEILKVRDYPPFSKERVRMFVEISKAIYAYRDEKLGDPRFIDINLEDFISKENLTRVFKEYRGFKQGKLVSGDTTYFSIVDKEGNFVSAIQSLFYNFGSGLIVPGYGFPLNNRASYFKFKGPNKYEPRKRPLHTLSSVLLEENGEIISALGTSGGDFRPQIHALLITNMLDYNMELWEAIEAKRFIWDGEKIILESGIETPDGYEIKIEKYPGRMGVSQGIIKKGKSFFGVCDIRGDGLPIGL